jgi:uncharacterized protein
MTLQPLSDAELEIVHEILERFGDKRAMNLEHLDGFLTALICGPDAVPPNEYLSFPKIISLRSDDAIRTGLVW